MFNVNSDALDGLIEVDLTRTTRRVLERYMTKEGYAQFMSHHTSPVDGDPNRLNAKAVLPLWWRFRKSHFLALRWRKSRRNMLVDRLDPLPVLWFDPQPG